MSALHDLLKAHSSTTLDSKAQLDDSRAQIQDMIEQLQAAGMSGQAAQLEQALRARYNPTWLEKQVGYSAKQRRYLQGKYEEAISLGSQALETLRQQDYNSESASAERERAAGLNPDLTGISNSQAGQASADEEVADPNVVTQPDTSGEFANTALSMLELMESPVRLVQSGLTLSNLAMDFAGKRTAFHKDEITNLGTEFDTVLGLVAKMWPTAQDDVTGASDAVELSPSEISTLTEGLGLSKHGKKLLRRLTGSVKYDENGNPTTALRQKIREIQNRTLQDENSIVGIQSSIGFNNDLATWSESYYNQFGKFQNEVLKLTTEYEKQFTELQSRYASKAADVQLPETQARADLAETLGREAQGAYENDYYNALDPVAQAQSANAQAGYNQAYFENKDAQSHAEADNAEALLRKFEARLDAVTDQFFAGLLDDIDDSNASEGTKAVLRQGVYQLRASEMNKRIMKRAKAQAKGSAAGARAGDPIGTALDVVGAVTPNK